MNDQILYLRSNILDDSIPFFIKVASTDPAYSHIDGILIEQRTIENDLLLDSISSSPKKWKLLDLLHCDGSKLDNLIKFALKNLQCLALRRFKEQTIESSLSLVHAIGLRNLQTLRLHLSPLNENVTSMFAEALKEDAGCCLKELFLQNSTFDSENAIQLLSNGLHLNRSISSLNISSCQLRDNHLKLILSNLPATLTKLDLQDNYCRSEGMAALVSLLLQSCCRLQSINLTNQHPGEFGGGLDLSLLGLSIPSNTSLRHLDLSFNMLTTNDISNLIAALSKNTTLEELNLMSNQLDDHSMQLIGTYMSRMKGLEKLSVVANKFGDDGANALYQGLCKNGRIVQLSMLRGFSVSDDIDYFLACNRAGRILLVEDTAMYIPLGLWPLIFERVNRLFEDSAIGRASVMSYMLKGYMFQGQ